MTHIQQVAVSFLIGGFFWGLGVALIFHRTLCGYRKKLDIIREWKDSL